MVKAMTCFACALLLLGGAAVAQEGDGSSAASDAAPAAGGASGDEASPGAESESGGVKAMAGMSILGNQEAPKSLVIVPWKSSELGRGIGVSRALDTKIRPVDKDVFERELRYYQLRAGSAE